MHARVPSCAACIVLEDGPALVLVALQARVQAAVGQVVRRCNVQQARRQALLACVLCIVDPDRLARLRQPQPGEAAEPGGARDRALDSAVAHRLWAEVSREESKEESKEASKEESKEERARRRARTAVMSQCFMYAARSASELHSPHGVSCVTCAPAATAAAAETYVSSLYTRRFVSFEYSTPQTCPGFGSGGLGFEYGLAAGAGSGFASVLAANAAITVALKGGGVGSGTCAATSVASEKTARRSIQRVLVALVLVVLVAGTRAGAGAGQKQRL